MTQMIRMAVPISIRRTDDRVNSYYVYHVSLASPNDNLLQRRRVMSRIVDFIYGPLARRLSFLK